MNKGKYKSKKGITLVALVITIIVLIILAGVSINILLGENGIITRARQAVEDYSKATKNEQEELKVIDGLINSLIAEAGDEVTKPDEYKDEENVKAIIDGEGNIIPVPKEFYYVGGTKNTGFVISDVQGDDLDNSKGGNQFVWIPVDTIEEYARTDFRNDADWFAKFSEEMSTDEQISVEKYKGYYIGRYEAGDKESTIAQTLREEGAVVTNTVTVKKGQAPYNLLTRGQAKSLAEEMAAKEKYTAKTRLLSSYAWDTALNYIQKTTNSDYATSSIEGNYSNSPTFIYVDINGISQTKESGESLLVPTGQTTAVNNIYDLGGNVWEWTTENYFTPSYPCVFRGGYSSNQYADMPAESRSRIGTSYSISDIGFRVTMFM